ncbi:MAG TPA: hypothetical protein VF737_00210 [Gemmatimonadaceae bacterium]
MYRYHLFGQTFASDIEFPELPAAPSGEARWTLTSTSAAPSTDPLPLLGGEPVMDGVGVSLRGALARYRLAYDDNGTFEIFDGGRTIVWHRPSGGAPDLVGVRSDVLGRVLAVALHAEHVLTLHGSGVTLGARGVAFLAPKLHGKSTTAAALVRAGAQLLGDDILAVTPGAKPTVLPGIPAVHLWRDSVAQLHQAGSGEDATRKQRVDWEALGTRAAEPVPLDAVYLLGPVRAGPEVRVTRARMGAVPAALALLGQAKIGALLGPTNAEALLDRCARLADAVPVYRLTVPRELDRLDELVRRLGEWHDAPMHVGVEGSAG